MSDLYWLTMRDLARESTVAFSTIYLIENGKRSVPTGDDPTPDKIIATFAAHGVEMFPMPRAGARRMGT